MTHPPQVRECPAKMPARPGTFQHVEPPAQSDNWRRAAPGPGHAARGHRQPRPDVKLVIDEALPGKDRSRRPNRGPVSTEHVILRAACRKYLPNRQDSLFGVRGGFGTAEPMVSATFRDSRRGRGPSAGGRSVTASFMPTVPDIFVIRRAGGRPGVVPGESTAAGHRSRPAGLPREGARTAGWPQGMHARLRRSP
jgi:hypothetical protein